MIIDTKVIKENVDKVISGILAEADSTMAIVVVTFDTEGVPSVDWACSGAQLAAAQAMIMAEFTALALAGSDD